MAFSTISTFGRYCMSNVLTKPSTPTDFTFISATTTSVTFSFTIQNGTASITSYTPYINGTLATGSGSYSSYTITGLTTNTLYTVAMTATNRVGTSAQSTGVSMTTVSPAPTGLTFISASTSSVTFRFTAPTGTATITGYAPYIGGTLATGSGTTTSYTITGLTSNTVNTVTIAAINSGGTSAQSTGVSMTTVTSPPTGLTFISATTTSVVIRFTVPNGTITSYTPSVGAGSGTAASYTITGLASNTSYSLTLTATGTGGTSASSSALSILTVPSPPTNLVALNKTPTSFAISFTPSTGNNTIPISGYTFFANGVSKGAGTGTTSNDLAPAGTLQTNQTITLTLTATNASGTSVQSTSISVTATGGMGGQM